MAALAMIALLQVTASAYGPERATFTMDRPAPWISFNSIVDTTGYGDERDFVMASVVGEAKDSNGRPLAAANDGSGEKWSNTITVEDSKRYAIRMYIHNNAASNLNLVAENVAVQLLVPKTPGFMMDVEGIVSSSNSMPGLVFDQATFQSRDVFWLEYIGGSALYVTNAALGGMVVPDTIAEGGAAIGYEALDGLIPGCTKYSGWLTLMLKAHVGSAIPDYSESGTEARFKIGDRFYLANGKERYSDAEPYIENGRAMAPIRAVSEALGYVVSWNDETKTAILENSAGTISLPVGVELPSELGKADIVNGRVYVPLRYLSVEMGAEIIWDDEAKTATIRAS
jgi:hypothetical protein